MTTFRKKPVLVDAVQWFPNAGIYHKGVYSDREGQAADRPYVVTIHHQRVYLAPGDWIIPEPDGIGYYPCKAEVFAATYELAESSDARPSGPDGSQAIGSATAERRDPWTCYIDLRLTGEHGATLSDYHTAIPVKTGELYQRVQHTVLEITRPSDARLTDSETGKAIGSADKDLQIQELTSSLTALRGALEKYGGHTLDCSAGPCDCGFSTALAVSREETKDGGDA